MKLSEIKGEKAIEVFADLLEPIGKIVADEEVQKVVSSDKPKVVIIKTLLKKHKKEVIEMMAILDGVPVKKYEVNFITLPLKLVELLNDEELMKVFTLLGQDVALKRFGSATENTEAKEN